VLNAKDDWQPNRDLTGDQDLPRTLSVANQKGGVGKTTTVINLAESLARAGQHTLVIDLDPQCNATSGLGLRPLNLHPLLAEPPLRKWLLRAGDRLDVLPGSRRFRDVDNLVQGFPDSRHASAATGALAGVVGEWARSDHGSRLLEHLQNGTAAYDVVLIDCPPSLGPLTQLALAASSEVLMPIQCEYFAMEGLVGMIEVIRDIMNTRPGRLEFAGILLTMYDGSLELTAEVDRNVRDFFGEIVFDTVIPRDANVAEAPSHGMSVVRYAPRSRGARAFIELCMEVLERE
jgi:chromosome partitioning protein